VLACPWHRGTVHFVPVMAAHISRDQHGFVGAAPREVFSVEDRAQTGERHTGRHGSADRTEGLSVAA